MSLFKISWRNYTAHRANFIINKSANLWNLLPNQLVNAQTVKGFQAGLDCWMISNEANRPSQYPDYLL